MKEEKGKILLQPSFTQQQQTNTLQQNTTTNNMTNKHDQQQQKRTSTMAGLPTSTNFPKTSKGQTKPENEEEEQLNIFQHSIQS